MRLPGNGRRKFGELICDNVPIIVGYSKYRIPLRVGEIIPVRACIGDEFGPFTNLPPPNAGGGFCRR